MPTETNPHSPLDLESKILRALCSGFDFVAAHFSAPSATNPSPRANDPAALTAKRATILAQLRAHHWQDPEHRVVFEALTLLPGRQASDLREQLPAQATRMGFPDVNWQNYFAAPGDDSAIETLVAQLLATSRETHL
jgi:hypothetical protein